MILDDKHPLLTNLTAVDQICEPLKILGVSYFHFARLYGNGKVSVLSNGNIAWHQHVFAQEKPASSNLHSLPDGYYFWSEIYPEQLKTEAESRFNIANTLSLLKHFDGYYDVYAFGSVPGKQQTYSDFTNKINRLENFALMFQEKAKDLIQTAEKSKILVPSSMLEDDYLQEIKSNLDETALMQYDQSLRVKHFPIKTEFGTSYITYREAECLKQIAKGKTCKETGELLKLADRTVESYMCNMRLRVSVTTSELIELFYGHGIDKFFL